MSDKKLKLLFVCGREINYTRNKVLLNAFSEHTDVINISSNHKSYLLRYLNIILQFLLLRKSYDVIFIGFYGHPLVVIFRFLTNKPIIFDAFVSTYQTLCFDRKKFSPKSIIGKITFFLDKKACSLANLVILDTQSHIDYFVNTFKINNNKFYRIFVGADESVFYPRTNKKINDKKIVLFYGEYQPLHGIEFIVKAAKELEENKNIIFIIIGKGKEKENILTLVKTLKINNIKFIDWVPYQELPEEISKADLCIGGHMGITEKAQMVIPGKVYQFIAMKKPTIIARNKANQELFHDINKLYFANPGDYKELASIINETIFSKSKLANISNEQYKLFNDKASQRVINNQIYTITNNF